LPITLPARPDPDGGGGYRLGLQYQRTGGKLYSQRRSERQPNLTRRFKITVTVANNAAAMVTNTATVSGGGETNTGNDSSSDPTTISGGPDLTIAKSHTGNFSQGQVGAVYNVTVTNSGASSTVGR